MLAWVAWALVSAPCDLEVRASRVRYEIQLFRGKPLRRDGHFEVELTSTATSPVASVELAVFLGASLPAIRATRPEALPTRTFRMFEGGGLAFRTEVAVPIPPSTTRTVRFIRDALPLDQDLSSITARLVTCKWGQEPIVTAPTPVLRPWWILGLLVILTGGYGLWRLKRR